MWPRPGRGVSQTDAVDDQREQSDADGDDDGGDAEQPGGAGGGVGAEGGQADVGCRDEGSEGMRQGIEEGHGYSWIE